MIKRAAACTLGWLLCACAQGAEIFYLDRDPFTNEYVGPVGPLVLSGEIVPGDYARLVSKIAEDENRFLAQNKLILASDQGNAAEAIKIAKLVKSLYTQVVVGPLTGPCAGACFLIYAAASERGTDGANLIGIRRPGLAESEWLARSTAEAALLEEAMQAPAREFLVQNDVPVVLVDEVFKRAPTDVYWLTEDDEKNLGAKSAAFQKFLAKNCAWTDSLERAVYAGERPIDDLRELATCRIRVTQPQAHKALATAVKEAAAGATKEITAGAVKEAAAVAAQGSTQSK
ncbi:MAG TPA: hypothetical protein VK437_15505 [Steroidobacteraceae bacterium]|nr:hypothetical protein [Steroidobacteraceae bacterium]